MSTFLHQLIDRLPPESQWIIQGLHYIKQARIFDLMQQLEKDVLRPVLQKNGKDSNHYKLFMDINNALYQAGEAVHIIEQQQQDLATMRQLNQWLLERNATLETKITRWETTEELLHSDLLEAYTKRIKELHKKKGA